MIEIKDKKDCCGCTACYSICPKDCIRMIEDNEGCVYPVVNRNLCVDCGSCSKACPVQNQSLPRRPIRTYAAKHVDDDIRNSSSSGGVFSSLSEWVILEGGVVFGARFDDQWNVLHGWTDKIEGLQPFMGSKYVQSALGDCFRQVKRFLDQGRWVLFTGTACQIAGIRGYLRKDYDRLLLVDVICHGVPVPYAWKSYLNDVSSRPVTKVTFRDKYKGWKNYYTHIDVENEAAVFEPYYLNVFMKGFLNDLYLRPSCQNCPSKTGRCGSDVTIGDFWGVGNCLSEFDDDRGISALLVNTDKGLRIIDCLKLKMIETQYERILEGNPALEHAPVFHRNREKFFRSKLPFSKSVGKCLKNSFFFRLRNRIKILIDNNL